MEDEDSAVMWIRGESYRWFGIVKGCEGEALPEDLDAARGIIDSLTRQLKVHDDVTANLSMLKKRIEHTHKRNQDAIQTLEDRLDEVEATWVRRLDSHHNRWLDEYNRIAKEIETAAAENKKKLKSSRGHHGLNRRSHSVSSGIVELKSVSASRRRVERSLGEDRKRIRDIDTRLKALTLKERNLNAELTKQLKAQLSNPFTQLTDEQGEGEFYGVCEITDSYEQTIQSLTEALKALENIGARTPAAISVGKAETKGEEAPSLDEVDEITIVMKRFLAKLRVQLASAHFCGSPSRSPPARTGIEKSPPNSKKSVDGNKKKESKPHLKTWHPTAEDKSDSYSSTPLNTPRSSSTSANLEEGESSDDSDDDKKKKNAKNKEKKAA